MPNQNSFTQAILAWYALRGRHDLPWQHPASPYRVWLSETMLQQTQVTTVIDYFQHFTEQFPSIKALADANLDQVMQLWAGLGYYRRAKNLHMAAKIMLEKHNAEIPDEYDALLSLPGIGPSTAGAILAIAYKKPFPILDGNVKRVLCRHYGVTGWPDSTEAQKKLWPLAKKLTPKDNCHHYTQAIMDLGATLCTRSQPNCEECPVNENCYAFKHQCTDKLPERKPKAKIPRKTLHFWIVRKKSGDVLLIQRPAKGIWANLWAFPEGDIPTAYTSQTKGEALQPFQHMLTHYRLTIEATLIEIEDENVIALPQARWCHPQDIQQKFGVPKPIAKLINQITDQSVY